MDALQAAQSVYRSTVANLAGKELELDANTALEIATFCATLAQAEAVQPRWIRIGGYTVNTAHIACYWFAEKDEASYQRQDELTVCFVPSAQSDDGLFTLYNENAIAGKALLDKVLAPFVVE